MNTVKTLFTKIKPFMGVAIALLMALVLTTIGQTVGLKAMKLLPFTGTVWKVASSYLAFIGIWAVTLAYLFLNKRNHPILKAIGSQTKGNNVKNLMIGLGIGFGMNMICAVVAMLHGDIHLSFRSFQPASLLLIFVCVFVQSSAEELICRGYLYQKIRKNFKNPWVAIVGNAVLFGVLHLGNPGLQPLAIANIIFVGILFSMMVYYMNSIWAAMAAHAAWNFTQNILLGLPNSGIVTPYSLFKLDAANAVNSFAYDTGFGIEGTLMAVLIIAITAAAIYYIYRNYSKKETLIWAA